MSATAAVQVRTQDNDFVLTRTSVTDRDANMKLGAAEGWSQSFERLDALLRRPQ